MSDINNKKSLISPDTEIRITENPNDSLTPKQIVEKLDQYIIGQTKAKRAVAVALRNRSRRLKLSEDIRDEVAPKNILMIGPTGVGKTEIARRLAKLCGAPFLKVEATKYTEVGYVGRDVESMVRESLSASALRATAQEKHSGVSEIHSRLIITPVHSQSGVQLSLGTQTVTVEAGKTLSMDIPSDDSVVLESPSQVAVALEVEAQTPSGTLRALWPLSADDVEQASAAITIN